MSHCPHDRTYELAGREHDATVEHAREFIHSRLRKFAAKLMDELHVGRFGHIDADEFIELFCKIADPLKTNCLSEAWEDLENSRVM